MAKQEIKLNKQVFGKISYPKVIDTEFKQLVKPEEVWNALVGNLSLAFTLKSNIW